MSAFLTTSGKKKKRLEGCRHFSKKRKEGKKE
jgi:hypothetical protein